MHLQWYQKTYVWKYNQNNRWIKYTHVDPTPDTPLGFLSRGKTLKFPRSQGWSRVAFLKHDRHSAVKQEDPGQWMFSLPLCNKTADQQHSAAEIWWEIPRPQIVLTNLPAMIFLRQVTVRGWLWDSWHWSLSPFDLQCIQCRLCCSHPAGPDGEPWSVSCLCYQPLSDHQQRTEHFWSLGCSHILQTCLLRIKSRM